MKALSVKQLWAWAIMLGAGKDIENRDWPTRFRGTVAIHASKGLTRDEYDSSKAHISNIIHGAQNRVVEIPQLENVVRGAIVGLVDIVDCVTESDSLWFEGDYGFVLKNRRHLAEPIACKGALFFWDVPFNIEQAINAALLGKDK